MILMDVKLDNIYGFNHFHINFSYPRRLLNSTIDSEFLEGRPNFKYKKAIILMGANATGKTSLGKALLSIFNFMHNGNPDLLKDMVCRQSVPATFSIDIVNVIQNNLVRFMASIDYSDAKNPKIKCFYNSCDIREDDSYETCSRQLDNKPFSVIQPSGFDAVFGRFGFRFCLSDRQNRFDVNDIDNKNLLLRTLESVIKTLDPSITSVAISKEFADSYVVKRGDSQILIQKGEVQDSRGVLSSGTKEGVFIAILVAAIRQHINGFYYCDEQFSHIQSDIEKRLFGIMVDNLGNGEQLIFTSHNSDMQDLNLPKHTFVYLQRLKEEDGYNIYACSASDYLKRSTDSVRCAAENDVFSTIPDDTLLDNLETGVSDETE